MLFSRTKEKLDWEFMHKFGTLMENFCSANKQHNPFLGGDMDE